MRYAIDIGHNAFPDIGAMQGYEDELNKDLGTKVANRLIRLGNEALIVNPTSKCWSVGHSLRLRCENANAARADRYVSFHFNAFNGSANGSEVYYVSRFGYAMAKPVLDEICNLNYKGRKFRNRGTKRTSYFQVLNETIMPAILIETAFCDNQEEMELYKAIGSNNVADAIVNGLIKEQG